MRFVRDALITIAILVVVLVIVGYASMGNMFSATGSPGRIEAAAAIRLRNLSIPADAKRARNPLAGDKDAWRNGLDHFGDHCAVCHGIDGRGGGEIAPKLYPRVPDMTKPRTQNLTDGEIFYIISNGVRWTGMPAWKTEHTPEETWHLVSLIRHLHALTPFDIRQIEAASGAEHEHGEERGGKNEKREGTSGQAQGTAALDVNAIAQALGRQGQTIGEVYKVGFPRTDLDVSVGGVKVRPGLALGSWCAFKASGDHAVADGDLVLTQGEVSPVISALQQGGFAITAVHNHLLNEVPRVMYVHFWGQGNGATLARGLRAVLERTKTPLAAPSAAPSNQSPGFDTAKIEQALGLKGTLTGGVLALSKPRPERITMMGVALPPSMGMATSINVEDAGGGTVAATGDFVLIDEEVNAVAAALRAHGIDVTALHNHMLYGSPQLYFMHFWAHDTADRVAAGLKAALDRTAK